MLVIIHYLKVFRCHGCTGDKYRTCHLNADKYLEQGYGAVLSFDIEGGKEAEFKLCEWFQMIINITKVVLYFDLKWT